jgi:heme exporter protein B
MVLLRQIGLLLANDLRQEIRNLELVVTATFFSGVILVIFALAFSGLRTSVHPNLVPGVMWAGVSFAGALTLARIFERERESDTLGALLVAPIERFAVYAAKVAVTVIILTLSSAPFVPGLAFLFPGAQGILSNWVFSGLALVLGCWGYASVGVLFAAGLARSGGRNLLLSMILYPLTTPILLYAVVSTKRIIDGHPDATSALVQLAAVDVVLFVVSGLLFESMLIGARAQRKGRKRDD